MSIYALPWNRRWLTPLPCGSHPWALNTNNWVKCFNTWAQVLEMSLMTSAKNKYPHRTSHELIWNQFKSHDGLGYYQLFRGGIVKHVHLSIKGKKRFSRLPSYIPSSSAMDSLCVDCSKNRESSHFPFHCPVLMLPDLTDLCLWGGWRQVKFLLVCIL